MYYKEEIINGVLCYQLTPNGEFQEYSKEELTKRLTDTQTLLKSAMDLLSRIKEIMKT